MRHHVLAIAAACGLAAPAAAAPVTQLFTSFTVLGDSLSDNGNTFAASGMTLPPSPPYFAGRWSDGPVWNEPLLSEFAAAGLPAVNYAFGGARVVPNGDSVPDLPVQAALAGLAGLWSGAEDLVSIWAGANDAFAAIGSPIQKALVETAADTVVATIAGLAIAGVENVLVFTLPDLGETPLYRVLQPSLAAAATTASTQFNDRLLAGLGVLSRIGGPNLFVLDTFRTLDTSGYAEPVFPCFLPDPAVAAALGRPQLCGNPGDYVYFDPVHPTARVHRTIEGLARGILGETAPVPLPAGGLLLLAALAGLALRRRA